jgi:hypothetical protein
MKTCPTCWSAQIERSKRRSYERLLSLFGIYPFRCNECGSRFHARLIPTPKPQEPPPLPSAKLNTNDSHPRMAP